MRPEGRRRLRASSMTRSEQAVATLARQESLAGKRPHAREGGYISVGLRVATFSRDTSLRRDRLSRSLKPGTKFREFTHGLRARL